VTIPVQTLANPTVGFRIVTSGDAIAVDFVQNETGTGASSEIATTTAAVTRAADEATLIVSMTSGGLTLASEARGVVGFTGVAGVATLDDGSLNNRLVNYTQNSTSLRAYAQAGVSTLDLGAGTATDGATFKQATSFNGVDRIASSGNGSAVATGTLAISPALFTRLRIGQTKVFLDQARNGTVARIRVYKSAMPDSQLQALST
jgi:hypothetical protein